jgi:hypothetical protein
MKINLFYSCLLICSFANGQPINIPDANFNAVLLAASTNNSIAAIGDILPDNSVTLVNVKIDTNNNGIIEVDEVQDITYLFLSYSNISDLTGIEYFINLKYLFINNNNISSINNVYGLANMERLLCSTNQISGIDLSNFSNLRILTCWSNQINSLDFSNNPLLEKVYCGNNELTNLDFSTNPLFNDLGCKNNPNLTSINIKNGTTQLFGAQTIYNECWTGCPNLSRICADSNEMNALQTYLGDCGVDTFVIDFSSNCNLGNEEYGYTNVNVFPNPNNGTFEINSKEDYDVAIYDVIGNMVFDKNNISQTIVTNLKQGLYLVKIKQHNEVVKILKMVIK